MLTSQCLSLIESDNLAIMDAQSVLNTKFYGAVIDRLDKDLYMNHHFNDIHE